MPDISNVPKASDVLKQFGYQAGFLIDERFAAMDQDRQVKLDNAISTLAGQDTAMMQVINVLQRVTDAVPGTPEHDEGVNLYSLMQTNYIALDDRLTANEDLTASLNTWKTGFVTAYNDTVARIDAAVLLEKQTRESEVQRLEGLIETNQLAIASANAARLALKQQLENTDASQTEEINALKLRIGSAESFILAHGEDIEALKVQMTTRQQEIGALQIKQQELEGRVNTLEGKFEGFNAEDGVAEFAAGLRGQVSPGGYPAPTV